MNNQRRKELKKVADRFTTWRDAYMAMKDELANIKEELERLKDEEQEYYDNMHENLQGGDKGQQAEEAVSAMDDLLNELGTLEEAFDTAENADFDTVTGF